jgi:N-acyl-D-aspartate/D-glutamate deacylase
MTSYDTKITGGMVYDGDGGEPVRADVGIRNGIITAVGDCPGESRQTLDATGLIVTPGFIDLHTHYDGQVSWDANMQPSVNHGVSTVVMGSCGVGLRRCAKPIGKNLFVLWKVSKTSRALRSPKG